MGRLLATVPDTVSTVVSARVFLLPYLGSCRRRVLLAAEGGSPFVSLGVVYVQLGADVWVR